MLRLCTLRLCAMESACGRNVHAQNSLTRALTASELITTMTSCLRSGMGLTDTCGFLRGWAASSATVDEYSVTSLVRARVGSDKNLSARLYSVCKLSERVGCSAVQCLEILLDDIRRSDLRESRRTDSTAVARMTVRVLFALPLVTTVMSELAGAHTVSFLLGKSLGWTSLGIASALYCAGFVWIRHLVSQFDSATSSRLDASGGWGSNAR
ncbi:type II secretion system F family protein [Alloscardovia venturai]|uniref:Type II secretion system F family protein n=1 Tax=Alloscardovia venturai TaxID=1769421 RepID=A0ABW2Y717_9BIFI